MGYHFTTLDLWAIGIVLAIAGMYWMAWPKGGDDEEG